MRTLLLLLLSQITFSQVVKDLDHDGIDDTVFFDTDTGSIICKLSTKNFDPIKSKPNLADDMSVGINKTKSGFEFYVTGMRAGSANQFRYEEKDKTIRLIGMSRYEFGPANNDGSGKSSVNILTNNYIGEWNRYDLVNSELIKMPTIKAKMYFEKTKLENFDNTQFWEFQEQCSKLFYEYKKKETP